MLKIYTACCLLLLATGCDWASKPAKPKFIIVNVLDREQYDDCHIKGSIQVDFMDLESYALKHFDKDSTQIVVHCSNYKCTASGESVKMLKDHGFKHVYAYEEGTAGAAKHGKIAMEGVCKQAYLQDFEKPKGYDEKHQNAEYPIIDSDKLYNMMQEFAQSK